MCNLEPRLVLLSKGYVKPHMRRVPGSQRKIRVKGYYTRRVKKPDDEGVNLRRLGKKLREHAAEAKRREEALAIRWPPVASSQGRPSGVIAEQTADTRRLWHLQVAHDGEGQLGFLCVREAFQNSLDAIFRAIEQGKIKRGEFRVDYDESAGTMTISDNGVGMSDPQAIHDLFLRLGASGKKEDRSAIGGFGIAKAFILGLVDPASGGKWSIRTHDIEVNSDMLDAEDPRDREMRVGLPHVDGFRIEFSGIKTGSETSEGFGYSFKQKLRYLFGLTDTGGRWFQFPCGNQVNSDLAGVTTEYRTANNARTVSIPLRESGEF